MDELTGRPNSSLFLAAPAEKWPWSLQECLQAYITNSYPNLHLAVMLMLFTLLQLSSVSYKRSASALHNLHTSQRCKKLCSDYHPWHSQMFTTLTELVLAAYMYVKRTSHICIWRIEGTLMWEAFWQAMSKSLPKVCCYTCVYLQQLQYSAYLL